MRKFDLSLRSSRSSYFATFRHQLTILSKTDALDEEKWLNMLGTFVKDWFRYESHFVHGRDSLVDILKERGLLRSEERFSRNECRSEERFSRNAETELVCRLLLEKKKRLVHLYRYRLRAQAPCRSAGTPLIASAADTARRRQRGRATRGRCRFCA